MDQTVTSRRGALNNIPAKMGGDFRWWMPAGGAFGKFKVHRCSTHVVPEFDRKESHDSF
jgi:hypothetical protein